MNAAQRSSLIVATFSRRQDARQALEDLRREGFGRDEISLLSRERNRDPRSAEDELGLAADFQTQAEPGVPEELLDYLQGEDSDFLARTRHLLAQLGAGTANDRVDSDREAAAGADSVQAIVVVRAGGDRAERARKILGAAGALTVGRPNGADK